jgi:hypothetical protein
MVSKKIERIDYNIDYINKINRLPKHLNWLKCFAMEYSFSVSFLEKMNTQVRTSVENQIGKKLNWNEIWLFLIPYESGLYLCQNESGVEKYYSLVCCIRYEKLFINYCGKIIWANAITKSEFDFSSDVTDVPIAFMWIPNEGSEDDGVSLPCFTEKPKNIKFKLKTNFKFKVSVDSDSMPHEGKFAITLWNTEDTEKVSTSLEKARSDWNKQTDNARETGYESLERGYCHDIAFDGLDGKVGYWYVDAGSAHDGIHEFLLKGLSESGIKIKHVEIQGL